LFTSQAKETWLKNPLTQEMIHKLRQEWSLQVDLAIEADQPAAHLSEARTLTKVLNYITKGKYVSRD